MASVYIDHPDQLEKALAAFKRQVSKEHILTKYKQGTYFTPPAQRRRNKRADGIRKRMARDRKNNAPIDNKKR